MDTRGCTMHYVMHKMLHGHMEMIFNSLDIDFIHSDILIRSHEKYCFIIHILRVAYGGKIRNGIWKALYLLCWQNGGDIYVSVDYWFFVTDSINPASVRHDFMVPVAHFGSICTQQHPSFYHLYDWVINRHKGTMQTLVHFLMVLAHQQPPDWSQNYINGWAQDFVLMHWSYHSPGASHRYMMYVMMLQCYCTTPWIWRLFATFLSL